MNEAKKARHLNCYSGAQKTVKYETLCTVYTAQFLLFTGLSIL